jgi:hypothetical protein
LKAWAIWEKYFHNSGKIWIIPEGMPISDSHKAPVVVPAAPKTQGPGQVKKTFGQPGQK